MDVVVIEIEGVVLGEACVVVVVRVGGGDVDTREAFEGREESGRNSGANPAGRLVQLLS